MTKPNETDGLQSRSPIPSNFTWLQLEPKSKTFTWGAETGAWNLGSCYTAQVEQAR